MSKAHGDATGVLHSRACAFPASRRAGAGRLAQGNGTCDGACSCGCGANPASPAPKAAHARRQYRRLHNCQSSARTSSNSTKATNSKCHGNAQMELKPQRLSLGHPAARNTRRASRRHRHISIAALGPGGLRLTSLSHTVGPWACACICMRHHPTVTARHQQPFKQRGHVAQASFPMQIALALPVNCTGTLGT